ncbi:hypothetical protein ISS05_01455 [Candidatus Woesearchaeota archaeon]|nr:hypothetical protein [Candidatus Woesearchaeota archaeon]
METSLQDIKPDEIRDFFKHICFVISEYEERNKARMELKKHIERIKTAPKKWILHQEIKNLHEKVGEVIDKEKKLLGYGDDTKLINQLNDKLSFLEAQLSKARMERNKALFENREAISEIHDSVRQIKSRMHTFITAKEERDKRFKELEKKVEKTSKHPFP